VEEALQISEESEEFILPEPLHHSDGIKFSMNGILNVKHPHRPHPPRCVNAQSAFATNEMVYTGNRPSFLLFDLTIPEFNNDILVVTETHHGRPQWTRFTVKKSGMYRITWSYCPRLPFGACHPLNVAMQLVTEQRGMIGEANALAVEQQVVRHLKANESLRFQIVSPNHHTFVIRNACVLIEGM